LLSPVNPQTDAKRWDPITDAILWLDYDQNRADLLLMKLVEQECADEVIGRSTYFRVMAPWRHANRLRNCPPLGGEEPEMADCQNGAFDPFATSTPLPVLPSDARYYRAGRRHFGPEFRLK
jgi:hypothetical protein